MEGKKIDPPLLQTQKSKKCFSFGFSSSSRRSPRRPLPSRYLLSLSLSLSHSRRFHLHVGLAPLRAVYRAFPRAELSNGCEEEGFIQCSNESFSLPFSLRKPAHQTGRPRPAAAAAGSPGRRPRTRAGAGGRRAGDARAGVVSSFISTRTSKKNDDEEAPLFSCSLPLPLSLLSLHKNTGRRSPSRPSSLRSSRSSAEQEEEKKRAAAQEERGASCSLR